MAIDRGDYHYDDAGDWDRACRHIALFLWWAAEHGLTDDETHPDVKAIAKSPTKYFIGACDTKLWEADFTPDGFAFAEFAYTRYLEAVERYAKKLKISDYEIPENAKTKAHFFPILDAELVRFRKKQPAKAKAKPKAKPKKKPKKR